MARWTSVVLLAIVGLTIGQECVPETERIDCWPAAGVTEQSCLSRGCNWCPAEEGRNIPWCHLPRDYGYVADGEPVINPNGFTLKLRRATSISYFGGDSASLTMTAEFQSDYRLRIKFSDGTPRWEVPLEVNPPTGGNSNRLYDVTITNTPVFSFKVIRRSSGTVLFDTSLGGFTFADQFLQIATKLPSHNLYGIGEQEHPSLKHSFNNFNVWPIYARDQPPDYNANMYGAHPHYTVLENDGNTHTVVIVNSNAQEFVVTPAPGWVYRTIGGVIDMYFFLGPTPENTVQQYTEAVGRTFLPPYWSLGFHICRYGYDNIENMKAVVDRTRAARIPQDVQYGDIDIMERALDFTYSKDNFPGLPEYVKELKSQGIKFATILDPCISIGEPAGTYRPFDLGNQMDIWIKKADGTPVTGKVWPEDPIYFPDYSKNATREWWITMIKEFHDLLEFDGIWIDMNEPANFVKGDMYEGCPSNSLNNPPYIPAIRNGDMADMTICPDHRDSRSSQYNTHNLFGWTQSEPTNAGVKAARPGKRPFVLSRSTFLGSGQWTNHWLGDNWSRWNNLQYSIIGMLEFNQFGVPFVGPDICGFIGDAEEEMCQRWLQLGAFYPFSRAHNGLGYREQDPAVWGPAVAESTRVALEQRYTLLPYLFTLFYDHWTSGNTVARATWHEFPADPNTPGVQGQFLWGSSLLVAPVLEQGHTKKDVYFADARWYSLWTGFEVAARKEWLTVDAPLNFLPLFVRGGHIIPTQAPALNTEASRQNPIGLIATMDDQNSAEGKLYYDDGESDDSITSGKYYLARYAYRNGVLETIVENDGYPVMYSLKLDTIRIMGESKKFTRATIGGKSVGVFARSEGGEITISGLNLPANMPFKLVFE